MPEGRRWSPENPSPAMKSFANFIRDKGYDVSDRDVAATFVFHREWQAGHASELAAEREASKEQREAAKAAKAQEREAKKAEREEAKAKKAQEAEAKKAEREAKKAEKEAAKQGADGEGGSDEAPAKTNRRLRTREEPVAAGAGASEASF
jgi:flagellar biosynthesis GTPase FlhF